MTHRLAKALFVVAAQFVRQVGRWISGPSRARNGRHRRHRHRRPLDDLRSYMAAHTGGRDATRWRLRDYVVSDVVYTNGMPRARPAMLTCGGR